MNSQAIATLTKSEIHDALGASFSARVLQFCKECDRKGLISWVKYLEQNYGSFQSGLEALALETPTEKIRIDIPNGTRQVWDRRGNLSIFPDSYVEIFEQDSLWVQWLNCLQYITD